MGLTCCGGGGGERDPAGEVGVLGFLLLPLSGDVREVGRAVGVGKEAGVGAR